MGGERANRAAGLSRDPSLFIATTDKRRPVILLGWRADCCGY